MLPFLGIAEQMAVLNLNDVVHVPSGLCFLTSPSLFPSSVINLNKSGRALRRSAEVTQALVWCGERLLFSPVSSFLAYCSLKLIMTAKPSAKKYFRDASRVIMFSIHSWRNVGKVKCWRKKRPTLKALIILAQLWFPQITIQWKWMGGKKKKKSSTAFFFSPFSMKWGSHNFKWKPFLCLQWWLLNVVADCKAISTADLLLKSHKEGHNGLRHRFDFINGSYLWFWAEPYMLLSCHFVGEKNINSSFRETPLQVKSVSSFLYILPLKTCMCCKILTIWNL